MSRHERLNQILELLADRGQVEVERLAETLEVSPATVRRDLDHLAERQLVTRTHGGAVPAATSFDLPLRHGSTRASAAKRAIARAAADLVRRGDTVALNGGTTTAEVARAIATHPQLSGADDEPGVTVVTNALNIATELAVRPHVKIVVVGGVARPQSYELVGPLSDAVLDQVNADLAFLGVDGVHPEGGATSRDEGEASVGRALARRSRRVVVAADHDKIGATTFAQICATDAFGTLLTDRDPGRGMCDAFGAHGVEVMVAGT